jgi:phosphoglycerate dehydrogenase-like enzyme
MMLPKISSVIVALDRQRVWWQCPTPAEPDRRPSRRPFHDLPNVLITPRSSSSTEAIADRRWSMVAANLDCFARGEPLENIVLQT